MKLLYSFVNLGVIKMNFYEYQKAYDKFMKIGYQELVKMKREMDTNKDYDNPNYNPLVEAISMKFEMIHG